MMKQDSFQKMNAYSGLPGYFHFLLWLIVINIVFFAGFGLYHEGYFFTVMEGDRSRLSILIAIIFVLASLFVGVHIFLSSRYLLFAERFESTSEFDGSKLVESFLGEISTSLQNSQTGFKETPQLILEIYADKLRSPLEMSGFIIDVLIRLGLIGTIIGFIMMLQSFVAGPTPSAENIQSLLITMSLGMGTALYTTFAGLVASTLLGVQQQILARSVEDVLAIFIRRIDEMGGPQKIESGSYS